MSGRLDRWEIVGRVQKARLIEKGNYRVLGKVVLEIMGATHKNRTILVELSSRAAFGVVQDALDNDEPIIASGVFDVAMRQDGQSVKLRANRIEPWMEATDGDPR